MENKNYVIKRDEMEVVDGKVIISSEELAAAIMSSDVNLGTEEEAEWSIFEQNHCNTGCR